MYWPVSTASGDSNSTNEPTVTWVPIEEIVNGTTRTFVSPKIYISYDLTTATDACGDRGRKHFGDILALEPQRLSTYRF